jgi:hypothetical protein
LISGPRKDWGAILRLLEGMSRRLRFIPDHGALVEVTCVSIRLEPLQRRTSSRGNLFPRTFYTWHPNKDRLEVITYLTPKVHLPIKDHPEKALAVRAF